ncbi:MAG: ligase-associated DNA damage response DEXH box helicase [Chitinophagaceae bacterium]
MKTTYGYQIIFDWLAAKGRKPFDFQEEAWQHINDGKSGLVNAPTGFGKTYSVFLGAVIRFINEQPKVYQSKKNSGLQLIWITPLRALAKDIGRAMEEVIFELGMNWKVGIRNGDTTTNERAKQRRQMPEVLIITPESLMLILAMKDNSAIFKTLKTIAVDEWHELIGSKRGVQVELALSRIVNIRRQNDEDSSDGLWGHEPWLAVKAATCGSLPDAQGSSPLDAPGDRPLAAAVRVPTNRNRSGSLCVWGISATIGNLEEAKDVLLSTISDAPPGSCAKNETVIVKARLHKKIEVESIFPDEIEKFPWAGHLGTKLVDKLIPIIQNSRTTLVFINTRGMSETWYQTILNACPDLAGAIALHHGSIEQELRTWVEDALHDGTLKAVVCTASLDLGVDFRPVDTVVQVGSPKGVARFLQRAGRSGHQPDAVSKIYFLPTHSLELAEAAALKTAIDEGEIESRNPMVLCYDVLIQYLCTLAVGEGFRAADIYPEVKSTFCYSEINEDDWSQILNFIVNGGNALQQYDEFKKVEIIDGVYRITNRRTAMQHRMQIGTIVSDAMLKVKFISGGYIGVIEEYFISRLDPGTVFTLAGRNLELVQIKDMTVLVRKSNSKKSIVPSWQGGRMPLSSNLSALLRRKIDEAGSSLSDLSKKNRKSHRGTPEFIPIISGGDRGQKPELEPELVALLPLFQLQQKLSHVPKQNELLVEHIETKDGFHLFVYPFEGRLVHEAMSALLAYRISREHRITFSIAMNDYGFELLSDQPIPVDDSNIYELLSPEDLLADIQRSNNATEMAKRKFRDISVIGGLIFQGMPGEHKKARHLQSSASLLYKVFSEYDPNNLLLRQAYQEVLFQQMEEVRLRTALQRIQDSNVIIKIPTRLTPFSFPIKVDSIRENLSSETIEDRVRKMLAG